MGKKVIYRRVFYREKFKKSPPENVIEKVFASRQKYKEEGNDLVQGLVELIMNSLFGTQIRRDINESHYCKSQHWMKEKWMKT